MSYDNDKDDDGDDTLADSQIRGLMMMIVKPSVAVLYLSARSASHVSYHPITVRSSSTDGAPGRTFSRFSARQGPSRHTRFLMLPMFRRRLTPFVIRTTRYSHSRPISVARGRILHQKEITWHAWLIHSHNSLQSIRYVNQVHIHAAKVVLVFQLSFLCGAEQAQLNAYPPFAREAMSIPPWLAQSNGDWAGNLASVHKPEAPVQSSSRHRLTLRKKGTVSIDLTFSPICLVCRVPLFDNAIFLVVCSLRRPNQPTNQPARRKRPS